MAAGGKAPCPPSDKQGNSVFHRFTKKEKRTMRMEFKKIICATDFSEISNRIIPFGLALAREFEAKLYACHIIDLSSVAIYGEFQLDPVGLQNRIMEDAREQLEKLIGGQKVEWEPLIGVGHTAEEIARYVEEKEVDLVISATRGRSGLKRLILGSVAERLMRTLTCPLLVVPGAEHINFKPDLQIAKIEKILVGCDFSPDSDLAFKYALSLAQEFQSELYLIHVIETSASQNFLTAENARTSEEASESQAHLTRKLQDMVPEEARNWCKPETNILEGLPYEELVKFADTHNMDMIVLGVRGHGLMRSLFLGSTTDRVARRSPCPVLSVSTKAQEGISS
jgi:nucleotide-binding universal stress UspA family protein